MARTLALALLSLMGAAACRDDGSSLKRAEKAEKAAAPALSATTLTGPRLKLQGESRAAGLYVREGTVARKGTTWGFTELAVDLAQVRLEIVVAKRGAQLPQLLPVDALAIINGGYFEADFQPSTWLKHAGVELAPKADTSRGGVMALTGRGPYVGPFSGLELEPELAVQSFPLIVEADGRPGIRRDDGRRAGRTVVCLVQAELHFIVIAAPRGEGPTLFESVALLREPWPAGFGCRVALNLDGGPSSGVWFSRRLDAKQRPPVAPVAYGIALVPR